MTVYVRCDCGNPGSQGCLARYINGRWETCQHHLSEWKTHTESTCPIEIKVHSRDGADFLRLELYKSRDQS